MKLKKVLALGLSLTMIAGMLTGCGGKDNGEANAPATSGEPQQEVDASKGSVYYLNFKPEVSEVWEELAQKYTEETGVPVKVQTAAAGTYEQTLMSEVATTEAPTLFQINGPIGYNNWKDYCADLSGTDLYSWMLDKSLAITEGEGVYGIPYVVEGYGIIYNDKIVRDYCALDGAVISSAADIKDFATLKAVAEDMQAKKADLGIEGAFASTSFAPGEDWRWQTHLANLPIYYEFKDKGIGDADTIDLTYADNYKNVFDLYINNSCTEPTMLGSKTVNDSMAEFALGKVAFVQNGNWGWGQISGTEGNVVAAEDVKFLPIYTGVEGEEGQGLCTGTENFFSVNSQASPEHQAATIDFVEWVFSSDTGKDYVTNKLGFIAPFNTFADDETPTDPLAQEVLRYMNDSSVTSVSWNFTAFPSQTFKDNLGFALLDYAQGTGNWDGVLAAFKDGWASEKAATK